MKGEGALNYVIAWNFRGHFNFAGFFWAKLHFVALSENYGFRGFLILRSKEKNKQN